ncbi:MAG: tol-pal system protein YbgF [Gammaproteobacteria bacterium]|nr:tol-pal system protein YbgF [Gammaproteobacteria bacterium]
MRFSFLLAIPVMAGCTLLQPAADDPVLVKLDELERRLANIERVVNNQSLVDLTQQVSALERRTDELQGRAETLEYGAENTGDRQRQLYADLDSRIQALEASVRSGGGVMDGGSLQPGELPLPQGSDRDNYQAAFELLKQQRYEPAALAFEQFLESFPESDLLDNAQYWLAESHYVTKQFEDALAAFQVVVDDYPRSRKVADALLKIGYCNYELKRWDAARAALGRVQADFAETTAARLAGQRLQRMEEEGV